MTSNDTSYPTMINYDSLFKTISKKRKKADYERDIRYGIQDYEGYNHWIGYLQCLYELEAILRSRKSRDKNLSSPTTKTEGK